MKMMKKMYDEGDDNMKRTIAEAWTKSREGKGPDMGDMGGLGGMGGMGGMGGLGGMGGMGGMGGLGGMGGFGGLGGDMPSFKPKKNWKYLILLMYKPKIFPNISKININITIYKYPKINISYISNNI